MKEINIATVALKYNLELLIHFTFQIILPHFYDSDNALKAVDQALPVDTEISKFVRSVKNYPHMMMTALEFNFLRYDYFAKIPFVVETEHELLGQANWLTHLSLVLKKLLGDRNTYIELARSEQSRGALFPEISGAIQVQATIANAECVTTLQAIELIQVMAQTLERIGRLYKGAGQPKRIIPPPALLDALKQLRAISEPLIRAMPDHERPDTDLGRA